MTPEMYEPPGKKKPAPKVEAPAEPAEEKPKRKWKKKSKVEDV